MIIGLEVRTLLNILCVTLTEIFFCEQRDFAGLSSQNNEPRFRLQAMEQHQKLRGGMISIL